MSNELQIITDQAQKLVSFRVVSSLQNDEGRVFGYTAQEYKKIINSEYI